MLRGFFVGLPMSAFDPKQTLEGGPPPLLLRSQVGRGRGVLSRRGYHRL